MTIDNEVKTLVKVCRLLAEQVKVITWGSHDNIAYKASKLLDSIDAVDDEPDKPAKCWHNNHRFKGGSPYHDRFIFECADCYAIGLAKHRWASGSEIRWWPEGGAK